MQEKYFQDVIDFIKEHKDNWRNELKKEPYRVSSTQCPDKAYKNAYMLSYSQFDSDFTNRVVKGCRGSIIDVTDIDNPKFVCAPFYKFVNHEQEGEDDIDWSTAKVLDKVDGMLMKCWYSEVLGKWMWVTNNGWSTYYELPETLASAYKEEETENAKCFWDVLTVAFKNNNLPKDWYEQLDKDYTYMFEMVSPKTRIIIDYPKSDIYYLGRRNNITWLEESPEELDSASILNKIKHPEKFDNSDLESVLARCNSYHDLEKEGVVVCDANFHRFKIKCNDYLTIKFAKHQIGLGEKFLLSCIREGTDDDLLSAFPTMKDKVDAMKSKIKHFEEIMDAIHRYTIELHNKLKNEYGDDKLAKKKFAEYVITNYKDFDWVIFAASKNEESLNFFKQEITIDKMNRIIEMYSDLNIGDLDVS